MPQIDLFSLSEEPAQHSLFGDGDDRLKAPAQRLTPDPDDVRRRMLALIAKVRTADRMPWPAREARMWQTVFPNMANWLPVDEAAQLRLEFAREMERLGAA